MANAPEQPAPEGHPSASRDKAILGLSTDQLAGLSIDELTGNKTAITMLMHYYKVLLEENTALKNDLNTARTYVAGYDTKRTNAGVGAILLVVSNVMIGFGVNLLTTQATWPGLASLLSGLAAAIAGTYFSFKDR